MVMFCHTTHRGSCGWAVNRSFSPGMVWVSLQILQSLVGLGTLNPFSPSPLFTGLCLSLCGMLLYRDLSPTRSMHWKVGERRVCVWVRNGKKVVRKGCVLRWKYSKPTHVGSPNVGYVLLIFWRSGKEMDVTVERHFSVWWMLKSVIYAQSNTVS